MDKSKALFDFVFFVDHVLTRHWIIFLEFELVWRALFILVGGVVMTSTSGRNELDFVTHIKFSSLA
jgi:hypothetical protein